MFNKCSRMSTLHEEGSHQGELGAINYFWEHLPTSYWSLSKKTYLEQIACHEDECRGGETIVSMVIFGRFLCSFMHTRAHTCTHPVAANYRNCVMRPLMLPLPLILCYINYTLLQTYMVLVVSAPSIHGNSQWVPTLRDAHPHAAACKARHDKKHSRKKHKYQNEVTFK